MPPLYALVKQRQCDFINKMISERSAMLDDPFMFALRLTQENNAVMYRYINNVINVPDHVSIAK